MSRCDLHIHSRFSARSEEWLFRRFDFPDSYTDPRELYQLLRERGMDFVTITDHDTIDGNLEIADLEGTFISEEVTTYFPARSLQDPSAGLGNLRKRSMPKSRRCVRTFSSCRAISRSEAITPLRWRTRSTASTAN